MSRALNVDATVDQVHAMCAKLSAEISTIEALIPQGTRVVFVRPDDARAFERAHATKLLSGVVKRLPVRLRTAS